MLAAIITGAVCFLMGGFIVLLLWTISQLKHELTATSDALHETRKNRDAYISAVATIQKANNELAERVKTCEDVARNALNRERAMLEKPIFIRPEEASMMAGVIGAMMDKTKLQ